MQKDWWGRFTRNLFNYDQTLPRKELIQKKESMSSWNLEERSKWEYSIGTVIQTLLHPYSWQVVLGEPKHFLLWSLHGTFRVYQRWLGDGGSSFVHIVTMGSNSFKVQVSRAQKSCPHCQSSSNLHQVSHHGHWQLWFCGWTLAMQLHWASVGTRAIIIAIQERRCFWSLHNTSIS